MEVGEKQSHAFTFHNAGEAPLTIKNLRTTCQCTVSEIRLNETREIAPGDSFDVKLTWKPEVQAEKFNKGADFSTNDPERPKINLRILGMVAPRMLIYPEREWSVSNVTDGQPTVFSGAVLSPVADHFQVVSVESRSKFLSFEILPLDKEKLEAHNGLCGYEVRMTVKPEMPLGSFRFPITIKTDMPERPDDGKPIEPIEFEILVSGVHRGPIQPVGREWIDDKAAISLGAFDATAGKKLRMVLIVKSDPEDGLQLTAAPICAPAELKVNIEREVRPDRKAARYFLNVEYPAGSPRATHRDEAPGRIQLQTNHPHGARTSSFCVFFSAY